MDINATKWEFGLGVTAGKASPGVTEGTMSPEISCRAGIFVTEPSQCHQHVLRGTGGPRAAAPQPVSFQGMNYSSGLGAKLQQELPWLAPNSSSCSYILGRCFVKQLRALSDPGLPQGGHCHIPLEPSSTKLPPNYGVGRDESHSCSPLTQSIPQKLCKAPPGGS